MLRKSLQIAILVATLGSGFVLGQAQADQPRMHDALRNLRQAHVELLAASDDKGSHKLKAIRHVEAAIAQVEAGIRFDRRH